MVEGGISELIKWWVYLLLMFGALAVFMFIFQIGQTSRYSSFVAGEIERGGVQIVGSTSGDQYTQKIDFTPEAKRRIDAENDSNYNGRYSVDLKRTGSVDGDLKYGDLVGYEVTGLYEIMFDWFSAPILKTNDQAIIQVRLAGSDGGRVFAKSSYDYTDFTYSDTADSDNRNFSVLTGFSASGITEYNKNHELSLNTEFVVPDINPSSNTTVEQIADGAFTGFTFEGDFVGPNIREIGSGAFASNTGFDGQFKAPNVESIGDNAFANSRFTGDFTAKNVGRIGSSAFGSSRFNGVFDAPNVDNIGNSAFESSEFNGSFNAPYVTVVGSRAFMSSKLEGYFNAPVIEQIGSSAFAKGDFLNGKIQGNKFVEY